MRIMQTTLMQLLFLMLISTNASFCLAVETYWVAYTGEPRAESGSAVPGGPKYLMKIDVLGNVLIPPTKVVPNASGYLSPLGGAIALTKAGNTRLAMWFPHKREVRDGYPIYKAVVQKSTLRVLPLERTKLRTINTASLSTTQRPKRNFIVLQILEELSSTDELDAFSIRNPSRARLLQELVSGYSSSFAVSADGKLLFFSNHDPEKSRENLFVQFLSAEGLPLRNPQFI